MSVSKVSRAAYRENLYTTNHGPPRPELQSLGQHVWSPTMLREGFWQYRFLPEIGLSCCECHSYVLSFFVLWYQTLGLISTLAVISPRIFLHSTPSENNVVFPLFRQRIWYYLCFLADCSIGVVVHCSPKQWHAGTTLLRCEWVGWHFSGSFWSGSYFPRFSDCLFPRL